MSGVGDILRFERLGGVALLTLDRPERLNAIGSDTHILLRRALQTIETEAGLRAIVITGAGKAFSAGANISEMESLQEDGRFQSFIDGFHEVYGMLADSGKLSIAAINGVAFGGGLELALACDLRIAGRGVKLGLPEIKLGLLPGAGGTQRLPRLVPMNIAKELILAGRSLDAERAFSLGLVNSLVEPDQVLANALELARSIAGGPPQAIAKGKRLLHQGVELDLAAALELEKHIGVAALDEPEGREGVSAFLAKRAPHFA
jgi:enoyl-CoA hydratase